MNILGELTDVEEASSLTGDELVDGTDSDGSTVGAFSFRSGLEVGATEYAPAKSRKEVTMITDKIGSPKKFNVDTVEAYSRFSISRLNAQVAEEKMQSHKSVPIYTRKSCTQNIPTPTFCPPSSNESSLPFSPLLLLLLYMCTVLVAWFVRISSISDQTNPVLQSPWIGQHNATKLIGQRLQLIQNQYQKIVVRDNWKLLRMSPNVTIETMNTDDGTWPLYIRTSAIFDAQPAEILKHLGWLQFDETQRRVDTFHESAELIFAPSHRSKVVKKVCGVFINSNIYTFTRIDVLRIFSHIIIRIIFYRRRRDH